MDLLAWGFYALAAAAALVMVVYLYRRRETPGRGRRLLAALRWAAIAVLILLLFDPEVPVPGFAAGRETTRILVDGSLSMLLPAGSGDTATRWAQAAAEARRLAPGREVMVFGAAPAAAPADSLAGREPDATTSRLLPALQAASEAGARRVVVLTDGGIEDAADVARLLPRFGLDLEVRPVGDPAVANRALAEVDAPAWAEAGEPLVMHAGIASLGPAGDTLTVAVRQGDQLLAAERVVTPGPGRVARVELRFEPRAAADGELVRYDLALEPGDAVPADDRRSAYVFVDDEPAGVALVSFRPDWEPRFLQPVLQQSLGLPVRGFLHLQGGRFVRAGTGADAGRPATEADVRRALGQADLVVLHGLGPDAPAWAREAARRARRAIVFPAGQAAGDLGLPLAIPSATPGEWYAGEVPASPVASLLASMRLDDLPPVTELRPVALPEGAWAPLVASRGRRGAGFPIVVATEREGRRTVVATAEGFWRWAFRDGESRLAYRRLWAALGGWLLQEERAVAAGPIRPVERVAPRGRTLRWVAPGLNADSVAIRLTRDDGAAAGTPAADAVATDTVVARLRGDTLVTGALAPGHYRYQATSFAGGQETASAEGPLTVETYSPEFARAAVSIAGFAAAATPGALSRRRPGEPLHTTPWPYLLLALAVSLEWTLRRRWGLR